MDFTDEIDEYIVLKLSLDQYKGTTRVLERGFQINGAEVITKIRNRQKELLRAHFISWAIPYYGNVKGWREDSPIYMLYEGNLVGGVYLCDECEYDESRWGQLHYAFMDPEFKGRGIYSLLFAEAVRRARQWNLQGLVLDSDRHMLPEVYIRWGAIPFEHRSKVRSWLFKTSWRLLRRFKNTALVLKHELCSRTPS